MDLFAQMGAHKGLPEKGV